MATLYLYYSQTKLSWRNQVKRMFNVYILFTLVLLAGCSLEKVASPKVAAPQATLAHRSAAPLKTGAHGSIPSTKFADLFRESKLLNTSEALRNYVALAEQAPDNPEALYNIAYTHMQSAASNKNTKEQALAIKYFNEILAMVPGNQSVLNALYNIYYSNIFDESNATAFDNAKTVYLQLSDGSREKLNPPSLARFAQRALWQEKTHEKNHQELRDILLKAMQENPHSEVPYIQLARLYKEDHYFALAIATLKLGNESVPDSVELFKTIASTYDTRSQVNGCNYEHSRDIANAAKYYKLAIPLKPEDATLHFELAQSLFDQNLYQMGLNETLIGQQLNNKPEDLATIAQSYSMLGFNQQATHFLQLAVAQGYELNNTTYHEVYMNQGDWKNAAAGFDAYIKAHTDYTVYDLIKSDIIAEQNQLPRWLVNQKISLASDWEENLFKFWSAKITADDLKKAAHTSCEKTEYYFYTGYQDYRAGQVAQAKSKFTAALNQNTYRFIERPLARYFLQHH